MSEDENKVVVLVADDEPSTLALVASHVRSKGYEVLEASDGDQAWQLAHEHLPDLVILDVMMPGMSGWEVCRKIREAVSLAHTGVVMLTGIGENLNEMTSPLYGADTYLDKPFEFTELDQRIDDTLASRKDGAMGRPDTSEPQSSTPRPGNGIAAQPSLAKATMRSEPPPYDDDEIDGDDDDDDDDDVSDDEETSSDDSSPGAAPAPSQDEDDEDDEEPATMPKPKLKSLAPKKAPKGVIAKAASGVGAFLEKAAKILQQPKGKAPKKAAPAKAVKKAAPAKAAKKAAPAKAAKKAAPKAAKKAAPKAAPKKAAPKKTAKPAKAAKKAAPKAAPKKAAPKKAAPKAAKKGAKAAPKKAAPKKAAPKAAPVKAAKTAAKKAPLAKAKPEAKKAASKPKPRASGARPTRPSPSGGNVTA